MTASRKRAKKKPKGITIADLERVMGRKADHISDLRFDPASGGFERTITFKLDGPTKSKRAKVSP